MRFFFSILIIALASTLAAQNYSSSSKRAIKYYEKGKQYFNAKQDMEAEEQLRKALEEDQNFVEAWFTLAQIYLDKREILLAAEYYLEGVEVDPDSNPGAYLTVADLEYKAGAYEAAYEHYQRWKSYKVVDQRRAAKAAELEKNILFAVKALENPVPFDPESLGAAVNTPNYEYWPSLSVDENTLFFTVLHPQNPELAPSKLKLQEDFYFTTWDGSQWANRTYLGPPVNTNTNEGAQSITADGKYIFFTACNRPDGHGRLCDIYFSSMDEEGRWSSPINLGDVVNTRSSEKHPAISADGRVLYFASNRAGGKGNYDLYKTEWTDQGWTKPENMGDSINTPGMEQSPFIHPDQKSLYFSSNGWPGMGQGDIFLSRKKEGGGWSTPKNLGYPINTHNEEIGFVVNARGTRAYYSSDRRAGTDTDIFSFEMPEESRPDPVSYITGRVFDTRTYKGIEAIFQLIDLETGELAMESVSNPGEGDYLISLPAGKEYAFNVSRRGYLFYSDHFQLEKAYTSLDPFTKDIPLEPIQSGKSIVLNNIFFDTDSHSLKAQSVVELNKIVEFLELNNNLRIEISGHTDNTGSDAYNQELSQLRAAEVVAYLVEQGIEAGRLESAGYGASKPVADNESEEGKARNRRTELKIL